MRRVIFSMCIVLKISQNSLNIKPYQKILHLTSNNKHSEKYLATNIPIIYVKMSQSDTGKIKTCFKREFFLLNQI